jgi:rhomboid family GlyGly-CTERM serine protease
MTHPHPSRSTALAVPAAAALALILLALLPGGFEHLAWDRQAIASGEAWRVLTGQFVHLGPTHAFLNLAGLAAVAWLFRDDFTGAGWAGALGASLAGVAVGLQWLSPGVEWYAGLSGAVHGLFAAGAVAWIRGGRQAGWIAALVLAGKLVAEGLLGPSDASTWLTGGPVLAVSHLWGTLGGLAWGLAWRRSGGGYNPPPRAGRPGPEQ